MNSGVVVSVCANDPAAVVVKVSSSKLVVVLTCAAPTQRHVGVDVAFVELVEHHRGRVEQQRQIRRTWPKPPLRHLYLQLLKMRRL